MAIVRDHLTPQGRLYLFHELPPGSTAPPIAGSALVALENNGFKVTGNLTQDLGRTCVACVIAEKKMYG